MNKQILIATLAAATFGAGLATQTAHADNNQGYHIVSLSKDSSAIFGPYATGDAYTKPANQKGTKSLGKISTLFPDMTTVNDYYVDSDNGTAWVKLTRSKTKQTAWVKASAFGGYQDTVLKDYFNNNFVSSQRVVKYGNHDSIWSKPYGTKNAKYLGKVANYKSQLLKTDYAIKDAKGRTWYHVNGLKNNQSGFVIDHIFNNSRPTELLADQYKSGSTFNRYLDTETRHFTINTNISDLRTRPQGLADSVKLGTSQQYKGQTVRKLARFVKNNQTFNLIQTQDNQRYWIKASALNDVTSTNKTNPAAQGSGYYR